MNRFGRLFCFSATLLATLAASGNAYAQSATGAPLFAVLNGGNECNGASPPGGPDCRKGDLDGIGSATVYFPTTTSVCFGLVVNKLAGATAAHIHRGVTGVNGPVVVSLAAPSAPGAGTPGASSGCVTATAAVVAEIRNDPTSFYVNVHNAAFPGGAVRGQLH